MAELHKTGGKVALYSQDCTPFFRAKRPKSGRKLLCARPSAYTARLPDMEETQLKRTSLFDTHTALGARMVEFGGWEMPVLYSGISQEHHAVRQAAGLFDISHMAEFRVTGAGSGAFLDGAFAGRLSTMPIGKAKYSLLLNPRGGIVDDVIAYRLAEDRFLVISNAGNRAAVAEALPARVPSFAEVSIDDISDTMSLIAVQGPAAAEILEATRGIEQMSPALADLPSYAFSTAAFQGSPLFVARTGYTGEDGFELYIASSSAESVFDALLDLSEDVIPCGLGCRDTLRLEAGMPLYGHELSQHQDPISAGLSFGIALEKEGGFIGQQALEQMAIKTEMIEVTVNHEDRSARRGRGPYLGPQFEGSASLSLGLQKAGMEPDIVIGLQ